MCEAITLYYRLMEIYEESAGWKSIKKRKVISTNLPLTTLFLKVISNCVLKYR